MRTRRGVRSLRFVRLLPILFLLVSCDAGPSIYEQTGFVMGTVAQLKVVSYDSPAAEAALARAMAELARIEALTTSYSDSSEVALLGKSAGDASRSVSADVDRILESALRVAQDSDGAFDPTTGPVVREWGFPDTPARPDSSALARAVERVSWTRCRRDGDGWRLETPGMELDLGGIAKGYAVDLAADALADVTGNALVNVGGDLSIRGSRPERDGWLIGVQDPREPSRLFLKLRLAGDRAVATSGDYQRFFEEDGVRYHHILDPRTGWPARGLRSVTVIAPDCALADAWATAAFVLGARAGLAALESRPDLEGVLVEEDAEGRLVLHETSGIARLRVE